MFFLILINQKGKLTVKIRGEKTLDSNRVEKTPGKPDKSSIVR